MKKFYQSLRSISIKTRLLIGFILVPVLILSVFFCAYDVVSKQMIVEKNKENSEQILTIIKANFMLNINKFEQQLDEITANSLFETCMKDAQTMDEEAQRDLYQELDNYINTKTHFLSNANELSVYNEKGTLTYSRGTPGFTDQILQEVFPDLQNANGSSIWFHTELGADGVVTLGRALYDKEALMGYVLLAINESAFTSLFATYDLIDQAVIVVDEENRYLFGHYGFPKGEPLFQDHEQQIKVGLQTYYLQVMDIPNVPWKVAHLVNKNYVLKELISLRSTILLYIFFILFLLLMIMTVIYRSFYGPLNRILHAMDAMSERHLDVRIEDPGKDELHELAENYNDLVLRIQDLVERVETEEKAKREAEIKMLQAQINPHFLFNTLNTLRYLAILNHDKPVSQGISALAKLLRNTITDSQELVEIREEIENVQNYIIIQKLRYGDLFETEVLLDEGCTKAKIMKFLLQPIVENAILHGFEEDRQDQLLTIRIMKEEQSILVEIKDNGKGFDPDQQEQQTNSKLSGIGMRNVEERIQLTYGEAYRMEILSNPGKGTIVRLYLPYIE